MVNIPLVGIRKVFCSVNLVCSLETRETHGTLGDLFVQIIQRAAGMYSHSEVDQFKG
jgi:hypothetical protein